ncbi:LysR family transcriptional regulator [Noviherbaspirillum suwonense]|uniref:LysR family transcriptional regulator n=1 Tax=Noviherbaspirillum suwonense TaxID=1224511 RepID=UPI0024B87292|nr:LysR family transcriptional regulator [Noviherbaspirillum suwonense]
MLRTFLAVAAEGSFTAAAQQVALTQAAVGLQMRSLEADLQRTLFIRRGKLVTLSEQGRALVPMATQILAMYEQARHGAPGDMPLAGTVQFGSVVSALSQLVRATLALKQRHPAVDLHIVSGKSNQLIAQVENRELDAAVVVHNPAVNRPSLVWTPLYAEPMVLLAPASAAVATPRLMIERHPFIRFDRTEHTGELVERTLRRLRAKPAPFLELNSIEAIVELVREGFGVALLPNLAQRSWEAEPLLRALPVPAATETRAIALVQLRTAARAEIIGAVGQQFLAALDFGGKPS